MAKFFDYQPLADDAGIASDDLEALRRRVEADYPGDEMMPEPRGLATTPTEG